MAAAASAPDPSPEILPWLKSLPVAPEYHPTLAEFQDPISYILKIEPEASKYGICKIIPPLPPPPKKNAIANLNRSLAARHPHGQPAFATRHQQIGFCPRKARPVQKPVWQSGESYTLQQFELKAKQFERAHLRRNPKRALSALEIESLFWKASADKPLSVEYANDMPGSAFAAVGENKCVETVAETAWNMRGASRAKGSLLRFMKEEIPGVTSPMVYIAMLFSWFAWHVEDHDLHSLNYLHMGAGKTWYGVPRDAAVAFEEVIRVNGYGGEVNPVVTFTILGEKTTVMSPEVLISEGIPCCRLVQNAGEFVVTFPRAYHSGFSHGFNCGEAANIATPEWLRVAKEAAIRRASINYPPMVSHFQLLYALALSLCSRTPVSINEPRSSRLKGKKRSDGEIMVKELFVKNVIANNKLLNTLLDEGSSCILLPRDTSDVSLSCNAYVGSQIRVKHRLPLGLCSPKDAMEASINLCSEDIMPDSNTENGDLNGFGSTMGKFITLCQGRRIPSLKYSQCSSNDLCSTSSDLQNTDSEKEGTCQADGLLGQALFACVKCGLLSFACVAVVQPREAAARYLMSADCSLFSDQIIDSVLPTDLDSVADGTMDNSSLNACPGWVEKDDKGVLYDILIQSADYQVQLMDQRTEPASETKEKGVSSLDLLAFAYGDSSDTEEEAIQPEISPCADENNLTDVSLTSNHDLQLQSAHQISSPKCSSLSKVPSGDTELFECSLQGKMGNSLLEEPHKNVETSRNLKWPASWETPAGVSNSAEVGQKELDSSFITCNGISKIHRCEVKMDDPGINSTDLSVHCGPPCSLSNRTGSGKLFETAQFSNIDMAIRNAHIPFVQKSDKDSTRMHIFCLEHAIEVEKQLRQIGGAHMMLLCHPDYPKVEEQAKALADELGIRNLWKDISFREPSKDDKEKIQLALEDEEAIPGNGDWAVKLGINLYYSASLCKSPLYSKQMPYNSVLYKAFGRSTPNNSPTKPKVFERRVSRQKKIVVAGKWCGKVWMSNQVHPYIADVDAEEPPSELHNQSMDWKAEACPEHGVKESSNRGMDQKTKTYTKSGETEQANVPERNLVQHMVIAASVKKPGKKRRKSFERFGSKKPKCLSQLDDSIVAAEDLTENPSPPCERTLRSGRTKCQTLPLHYYDEKKIGHGILNLTGEVEGGPSSRLRRRPHKCIEETIKLDVKAKSEAIATSTPERQIKKKAKKTMGNADVLVDDEAAEFPCDIEGCTMGFSTKKDLLLHKRNICPIEGCGKNFFSHKYLVQHRRVHMDDRPLKCPWKGCRMTFKWAWARTEHIRVHTGDRPYVCREPGCGQTFRFVSDFSRHKRKTGHSVKKKGRG